MARALDTLKRLLTDEAPSWLREKMGPVLLEGAAAVFVACEAAWDSAKLDLLSDTATGEVVDEHLAMSGAEPRRPGEPDAEAAKRAKLTPRGTVAWLKREIQLVYERLGYGEFYRVRFVEPHATVSDDQFFADDLASLTKPGGGRAPKMMFWVNLPRAEVVQLPDFGAFTDVDDGRAHTDAASCCATETLAGDVRLLYQEVERLCERARGASVGYGLTCEPTLEIGHLAVAFFEQEASL